MGVVPFAHPNVRLEQWAMNLRVPNLQYLFCFTDPALIAIQFLDLYSSVNHFSKADLKFVSTTSAKTGITQFFTPISRIP